VKAYKYVFDENNLKNSIDYPPNACYTSKLQPDQPSSMTRRSPFADSAQTSPQNVLLNLARRRLSGEPIGLFNRASADRTGSGEGAASREEVPPRSTGTAPTQAARQAMRMLANSIATRTIEQLGRLGERISLPVSRNSAMERSSPASRDSLPTQTARIAPIPITAALTQGEPAVASSGSDEIQAHSSNEALNRQSNLSIDPSTQSSVNPTLAPFAPLAPTTQTIPLSPISSLFSSLRNTNQSRDGSILSNIFRPDQSALENARELARNLTRSAPINTMLTNVLNSGLINRLFTIRNRPEVLNRRSRQIEARRKRQSRLRRRQARDQQPPSFARLREMNKFPSGAFDFSQVAFGAPILLSLPHFLKADPFYLQQVRHDLLLNLNDIGR
jgi:hypothetical protein